jgi:glutaredoxin
MLGRATDGGREFLHHQRIDAEGLISSHTGKLMNFGRPGNSLADARLVAMARPQVELLTRDGCTMCARVHARLAELAGELGFELSTTDVDAAAAAGNPGLRAEFGDRLPVILLDGREHSYWDVDEPRLRADLAR